MPLNDTDELLVIKMHGPGRKTIRVGDRLAIRPVRLRKVEGENDDRAEIVQRLQQQLGTDPLVVQEMAYWPCGVGMVRFTEGDQLGDWRRLSNYVAL